MASAATPFSSIDFAILTPREEGVEWDERKLAKKAYKRKRRPFSMPIEHSEGMSRLTDTFTQASTSADLFVRVYVGTATHSHARTGCLFCCLFFQPR